jgi:hypothetical protein
MTSDIGIILMAVLAGIALGVLYLSLLWASVRLLPLRRGAAMFFALALARAALVMAAFASALFLNLPPIGIAAAVAGFIAVRLVATRKADPSVGAASWK